LGLLLAVAVLAVAGIAWGREARERARDVAVNKPWRTSSVYAAVCVSPKQDCADGSDYFFHTQDEQSPWIEFDLGSSQRIRGVRVINRKDCCGERAVPLVVEVSTDQSRWKTVARRDAVFSSWLAEFAPVDARWVRLRLEKRAPLHLAQVRILR
jgi:F5/8 type C domain-containing protein